MGRYPERDETHDLLSHYLQEISRFPLLTPERERELGYRIRQNDKVALEELVKANLRFVVRYAKRYRNTNVLFLDLINEGNIGLIHAATKFDPDKNVKFITYAVWWIRQAIHHALSEQGGTFRLPPKRASLMYRLEKAISTAITEGHRVPTPDELAASLGISVNEVQTLLRANPDNYSLNAELNGESRTELSELIEQTTIPSAEDEMQSAARHEELLTHISALKPKERIVLMLRYGISDNIPRTKNELATLLTLDADEILPKLERAEHDLCELLQISRAELAELLLYTSPNRAAVDQWNALDDRDVAVREAQPDRHAYLQTLRQSGAVQQAIDEMPTAGKVLIRLRYGVLPNEELTLRQIGELLHISRERVRQIEAAAERKTQKSARAASVIARGAHGAAPATSIAQRTRRSRSTAR